MKNFFGEFPISPIYTLYIMMFLLPLENTYKLGGEVTIVRLVGIALFVHWILHKLVIEKTLVIGGRTTAAIGIFMMCVLLSFYWSPLDTWTIRALSFAQLGVWVVIILDQVDTRNKLESILWALILGNLINAALIIYQFNFVFEGQYWQRVGGGFNNANNSASSLAFLLPILYYNIIHKKGIMRIAALCCALGFVVAIVTTLSRTGLIMTIVGFSASAVVIYSKSVPLSIRYSIISVGLVIFALLNPPQWLPIETSLSRLDDLFSEEVSFLEVGSRGQLGLQAIDLVAERPILGYGLGRDTGRAVRNAHNLFLETWLELGILGVVGISILWLNSTHNLQVALRLAKQFQQPDVIWVKTMGVAVFVYFLYSLTAGNETVRLLWFIFALGEIVRRTTSTATNAPTANTQPAPRIIAQGRRKSL